MTHRASSLPWVLACALGALLACNTDDTELTARAQGAVNQQVGPYSNVQVVVHGGVATLTGMTTSEYARARAVETVKLIGGIREVKDQIASDLPSTTRTTGAPAP